MTSYHDEAVRYHVARTDFNPLSFGQMMRVLMVERGLTVRSLAALAGVNPNTIGRIRQVDATRRHDDGRVDHAPTALNLMKIVRGLNIILPVSPPHVVQLFLKCGYAPPMPFVVSQFSSPEQTVVAFDGRGWLPTAGVVLPSLNPLEDHHG